MKKIIIITLSILSFFTSVYAQEREKYIFQEDIEKMTILADSIKNKLLTNAENIEVFELQGDTLFVNESKKLGFKGLFKTKTTYTAEARFFNKKINKNIVFDYTETHTSIFFIFLIMGIVFLSIISPYIDEIPDGDLVYFFLKFVILIILQAGISYYENNLIFLTLFIWSFFIIPVGYMMSLDEGDYTITKKIKYYYLAYILLSAVIISIIYKTPLFIIGASVGASLSYLRFWTFMKITPYVEKISAKRAKNKETKRIKKMVKRVQKALEKLVKTDSLDILTSHSSQNFEKLVDESSISRIHELCGDDVENIHIDSYTLNEKSSIPPNEFVSLSGTISIIKYILLEKEHILIKDGGVNFFKSYNHLTKVVCKNKKWTVKVYTDENFGNYDDWDNHEYRFVVGKNEGRLIVITKSTIIK